MLGRASVGGVEAALKDILQHAPAGSITSWKHLPSKPASYASWPQSLEPRLLDLLHRRGIERPYTHQVHAIELVRAGKNVVVVTPTASGKTLCYNVPVIQRMLEDPTSRALYLFPTKALAQDQLVELQAITSALGTGIKTSTYDGDTPPSARTAIRSAGHIVISNPDMLHAGILPQHTRWLRLFENLQYVVIDELHTYRGVFGSHVANVLQRLKRICAFYGSHPQFICCSATIANPTQLAEDLVGEPFARVDDDGAPRADKHLILYNPPVVNVDLGIRRSSLLEATALARTFLTHNVQTILFGRSRLTVELLVTYLKQSLRLPPDQTARAVRGYRGGYLPTERRDIEAGLRAGNVRAVVSTNALELGIDIGRLDAAVLVGYPGTLASTWQQMGRAGRRSGTSVAVLVASSAPLDQHIINHPQFFMDSPVEGACLNPENPYVLNAHVKCGAFELPFQDGEPLGSANIAEPLQELEQAFVVHHTGAQWHWATERFPAAEVSLRLANIDNVAIIDTTHTHAVIGELDQVSALTMLHESAIYLHEGVQFHVDRYDVDERKAYVRQVDSDYYTDAELDVDLRTLSQLATRPVPEGRLAFGEVSVTIKPSIYKKIKFHTHENIGFGEIHLPAHTFHTWATWLELDELPSSQSTEDLAGSLAGVRHVLAHIAPLHLMCDPRDMYAVAEVRSPTTSVPTLTLYDAVPGGVGLAERLFECWEGVTRAALEVTASCPCLDGCPSCIGPSLLSGASVKARSLALLDSLVTSRAIVR